MNMQEFIYQNTVNISQMQPHQMQLLAKCNRKLSTAAGTSVKLQAVTNCKVQHEWRQVAFSEIKYYAYTIRSKRKIA
jgi:hypothetical protein